ncbi:hypothetical protein SmJEL517_g01098 [Synchytrium microbalum]|uniref:C2H2-type domain-containing protein n=1 Tax=Synchytrium microbalum TaxID=1806994 RepID=A0A507C660_9FUNG|nr:uncharacterized protein SmJEL517_g01098 [Synchytrium microbalum]TPX37080.1 hypothetical protein SmJEL517_g01098 [Synchytrium microbalum]
MAGNVLLQEEFDNLCVGEICDSSIETLKAQRKEVLPFHALDCGMFSHDIYFAACSKDYPVPTGMPSSYLARSADDLCANNNLDLDYLGSPTDQDWNAVEMVETPRRTHDDISEPSTPGVYWDQVVYSLMLDALDLDVHNPTLGTTAPSDMSASQSAHAYSDPHANLTSTEMSKNTATLDTTNHSGGPTKKRSYKRSPYQCAVCKQILTRKYDLQRHMLVHNPIRVFCPYCAKTYSREDNLQKHIDNKH